jgi:hypothetical protein
MSHQDGKFTNLEALGIKLSEEHNVTVFMQLDCSRTIVNMKHDNESVSIGRHSPDGKQSKLYIGYGSKKGEEAVGNRSEDEPTKYTKEFIEKVINQEGTLLIPTQLVLWPGVTDNYADTYIRVAINFKLEVDINKFKDVANYITSPSDDEFKDEVLALEMSDEESQSDEEPGDPEILCECIVHKNYIWMVAILIIVLIVLIIILVVTAGNDTETPPKQDE